MIPIYLLKVLDGSYLLPKRLMLQRARAVALVLLCLYGKSFKELARDEGRKILPLRKRQPLQFHIGKAVQR
jgi:hypothetical protein